MVALSQRQQPPFTGDHRAGPAFGPIRPVQVLQLSQSDRLVNLAVQRLRHLAGRRDQSPDILAALLDSRTVSLASILAAVVLGLAIWFPPFRPAHGWLPPLVLTLLAGLVIARHRANLARLRHGTEPRLAFGRRAPSQETPPT